MDRENRVFEITGRRKQPERKNPFRWEGRYGTPGKRRAVLRRYAARIMPDASPRERARIAAQTEKILCAVWAGIAATHTHRRGWA